MLPSASSSSRPAFRTTRRTSGLAVPAVADPSGVRAALLPPDIARRDAGDPRSPRRGGERLRPTVGPATAFAPLNLRLAAKLDSAVIMVIPQGGKVTPNGRVENGFQDVTCNGTAGWAHGDYLKAGGSSGGGSGTPSGTAVVHRDFNLRSGASIADAAMRVLPGGASVILLGEAKNGF